MFVPSKACLGTEDRTEDQSDRSSCRIKVDGPRRIHKPKRGASAGHNVRRVIVSLETTLDSNTIIIGDWRTKYCILVWKRPCILSRGDRACMMCDTMHD